MNLSDLMLSLETDLADYLGLQSNGAPAIFSEPPVADTTGATGLACIVKKVPKNIAAKSSSRGEKYIDEAFLVTLVQFNRDASVMGALRIIQKKYDIYNQSTKDGTEEEYEQARVYVRNRGFI